MLTGLIGIGPSLNSGIILCGRLDTRPHLDMVFYFHSGDILFLRPFRRRENPPRFLVDYTGSTGSRTLTMSKEEIAY